MEGAGQVKRYLEEPKGVQPTALHLHGGWQPRSPFAAPQAWCLINAQGGNVWDGASHQQCRATASLSETPQPGAGTT